MVSRLRISILCLPILLPVVRLLRMAILVTVATNLSLEKGVQPFHTLSLEKEPTPSG